MDSQARAEIFGHDLESSTTLPLQQMSPPRSSKAQYKGKDLSHIDPDYRRDIDPMFMPIYHPDQFNESTSALEDPFPDLKHALGKPR
jgi:hypothetical protein